MNTFFAPATGLDIVLQKITSSVAIATPVSAGTGTATSGVSNVLTQNTTVDIPAGGILRVVAWNGGSNMPVSCTDSLGNTYSTGWSLNAGTFQGKEFYVVASSLIPSGTTVTVTHHASSTNGYKMTTMVKLEGISAYDFAGTGVTSNPSTGTAASLTTAAFTQANTLVLSDDLWNGGSGDTFTFGNGFTGINSTTSGVRICHTSYKIVSATTAQTLTVTDTVNPFIWSLNYSAWKGF